MQQTVMVFADAAARTTALSGVVAEGMLSYLKDTNAVEVYDGANWVASDDPNAIQNTIVDAKGDLITATGADVPARLAVGSNGTTLVADSAEATGLKWANVNINPNLIINGNFTINQRGYVSGANLASGSYGFDRWKSNFTNTTLTFTSAPAGQSVTINSGGGLQQIVEQANVPAGTYTLSFSGTATGRIYNSGATPPSYAASPISFTADGLANVVVEFTAVSTTKTLSKVKLELSATATTYVYAGTTIEGELAACQRYYYRNTDASGVAYQGVGQAMSTTVVDAALVLPVTLRVIPTALDISNMAVYASGATRSGGTFTLLYANKNTPTLRYTHGSAVFTNGSAAWLVGNSANCYVGLDAEL
jgi:hypothetical protein